jgi:hypothetical protein
LTLFGAAASDVDTALDWWLSNLPEDIRSIEILRTDKARIRAAERIEPG